MKPNSNLFSYKNISIYLLFSFIANILNWFIAYYISTKTSSDLIILHYNVDFGADLIGNAERIYTIPILGLVIILINLISSFAVRKGGEFIVHSLFISALVANIFLSIALGALYLVNFR